MSDLLRISGFSSGLDIDSMVKTLMKAESAKLDKLKQTQTKVTWQQEAYRDISTSLVDFRNNKLAKYSLSSSLSAKTSDVSGNTAAVSVRSMDSSANGSLTVSVTNLATAASAMLKSNVTDPTAQMSAAGTIKLSDGTKNVDIAFTTDDTFNDVIARINSDKTFTALYDKDTQSLSIVSNTTGNKQIELVDGASILSPVTDVSGKDAHYKVNGLDMTSASNSISINGFNLQLKAETGGGGATTISSRVDTDAILSTITSFLTDYNAVVGQINGKLGEAQYRGFPPLTDTQKQDMKDKDIELWESKAKSGLLRNDTILSSLVSNMRSAVSATVDTGNANIKSLQSIGINTGSYSDKGKLVIYDESALRKAIEEDPDAVMALFTAKSSDTTPESSTSGLFTKLSSQLMTSLTSLSSKAGTSTTSADKSTVFIANSLLGDQLRDISSRISNMTSILNRKEDAYYKQFTAMETAINKYSSQSSAFSSF